MRGESPTIVPRSLARNRCARCPTARRADNRRHFGRGEEGLHNALEFFAAVRGRPRKGIKAHDTTAHAVRLPNEAWELLEACAKELGVSRHALCKRIFIEWLYTSSQITPKASVATRSRKRRRRVA